MTAKFPTSHSLQTAEQGGSGQHSRWTGAAPSGAASAPINHAAVLVLVERRRGNHCIKYLPNQTDLKKHGTELSNKHLICSCRPAQAKVLIEEIAVLGGGGDAYSPISKILKNKDIFNSLHESRVPNRSYDGGGEGDFWINLAPPPSSWIKSAKDGCVQSGSLTWLRLL